MSLKSNIVTELNTNSVVDKMSDNENVTVTFTVVSLSKSIGES